MREHKVFSDKLEAESSRPEFGSLGYIILYIFWLASIAIYVSIKWLNDL